MIERWIEKFLFASRWLLAPLYMSLVFALLVLLLKTGQHLWHFMLHSIDATETDTILNVLSLIDLSLTGALIVIVIFSGYENFVSRIDVAEAADWPEWMAKIDFAGLKLKLMSSIVAISAVQLLRVFMNVKNVPDREMWWQVGVHLVFVVSAFLLALTDRLSGGHHGGEEPKADKPDAPAGH
jgi:uncharacterized protein (TIGR00645 family)